MTPQDIQLQNELFVELGFVLDEYFVSMWKTDPRFEETDRHAITSVFTSVEWGCDVHVLALPKNKQDLK